MDGCIATAAVVLAGTIALARPSYAESVLQVGSLREARIGHTATLLADGRVLVVGGSRALSAELFDPATRTFHSAAPPNVVPRYLHAAALLSDGHVLVIGGTDGRGALLRAVERYDPVNDRWIVEAPLDFGRISPRATRLADGRVLVSGGYPREAEIYDPATRAWSSAGAMDVHRLQGGAARLSDGRVLVAGGRGGEAFDYHVTAVLYDPARNDWTATGSMLPSRVRTDNAVPLGDGRLLMAGGFGPAGGSAIADSEAYDQRSGAWSSVAPLPAPRAVYAASRLHSGDALLAGGIGDKYADSATSDLFVYEAAADRWRNAGRLSIERVGATATLLQSGAVLIAGGSNRAGLLLTAELYVPDSPAAAADIPALSGLALVALSVLVTMAPTIRSRGTRRRG